MLDRSPYRLRSAESTSFRVVWLGRYLLVPAMGALIALFVVYAGCSSKTDDPPKSPAVLTNACASPKDRAAIFAGYCAKPPDPKATKSFAEITGDCATKCVLDRERESPTCVIDCLRAATDKAVSDPCLQCHDQLVACARKNCLSDCINGPLDVKCLNCMCGDNYPDNVNCYDPLNKCSALALPYCQQWDAGTFDSFPTPPDAGCGK